MSKPHIIIPEEIAPYIEAKHCDDFPIDRYFVTEQHKEIIDDILKVKRRTEEMHKLGLPYINSALFYGVPGTGKTTFGQYIAYKFDMDFVKINYASLMDGVFGNTTERISKIFRFMSDKENCVFMMDEIDCISQKRGTESNVTGGEISRITITIMQEMDRLKEENTKLIVLGATNRRDIMDEALINRFAISKEIRALSNTEKEGYIRKFLDSLNIPYDLTNIRDYCARGSSLKQRSIEADMIRCIADWIDGGKQKYVLNHIREDR